jgi:hypothetical protein
MTMIMRDRHGWMLDQALSALLGLVPSGEMIADLF